MPNFAPATGYISFFTLILYIASLILLTFAGNDEIDRVVYPVVEGISTTACYRPARGARRNPG